MARDNAPGKPVEWRMRAADGTWMEVETTATGQLDDPDVQGIVLNSRNVTERKRLEAQLRQSQRLESVGQLAGGIAHDFNNFLSVIRGYARFLTEAMDEEEPLRSDALEIEKAAERASRLTSQLLVFSRNEVVQRRVVDLAEVLGGLTSPARSNGRRGHLLPDRRGAPAAARGGRPDADGAGAREPRGERARRDARGRRAPHRAGATRPARWTAATRCA